MPKQPLKTPPSDDQIRTMSTSKLIKLVVKYEIMEDSADTLTEILKPFLSVDSIKEIQASLAIDPEIKKIAQRCEAELDKRIEPRWNKEELFQRAVEAGKKLGIRF